LIKGSSISDDEKDLALRDIITVEATILHDGAVFNLKVLRRLLGQTEESTKKWVKQEI
jgi:hypothetical protein